MTKRTDLSAAVELFIRTSSAIDACWSDLTFRPQPTGTIKVAQALDPFDERGGLTYPNMGIYILPGYREYDRDGRRSPQASTPTTFVTVVVSMQLTQLVPETEEYDVAPIEEWSKVMNLKDDLDTLLDGINVQGMNLDSMEPEVPDQIELEASWFIEITRMGFRGC